MNVTAQRVDPESLLNWIARAIRTRKESPELAWGDFRTIDIGDADVLAHACEFERRVLLAVHWFATDERTVDLGRVADELEVQGDLLADSPYEACDLHALRVDGLGYRWLAAVRRAGADEGRGEGDEEPAASPRQAESMTDEDE